MLSRSGLRQAKGYPAGWYGPYQWVGSRWCCTISFRLCWCGDYYHPQISSRTSGSDDLLPQRAEGNKQEGWKGKSNYWTILASFWCKPFQLQHFSFFKNTFRVGSVILIVGGTVYCWNCTPYTLTLLIVSEIFYCADLLWLWRQDQPGCVSRTSRRTSQPHHHWSCRCT